MGLKWSWEFGVRHLILESDCLELVQDIEQYREMDGNGTNEMEEILSLCRRAWDVQILWCNRERNSVADLLARYALTVGAGVVQFKEVSAHVAAKVKQEMSHNML